MSITELRTASKDMISKEEDPAILEAVYTILNKTNRDAETREELTARAKEAEDDIRLGRTYTVEEVRRKIDAKFNK